MDQQTIDRRMADASRAEEQGEYREAARLYNQLGKDIQAACGRFDPQALDAFEALARSISKGAESGAPAPDACIHNVPVGTRCAGCEALSALAFTQQ
ncbi:hypothetical protein [Streptomyces sp. NPDC056987]|uniref:hypothetical protein n=1 Tax=Streptomyces sp. NPDC056987 TaxID=3345988 RepID=UPI0036344ADA